VAPEPAVAASGNEVAADETPGTEADAAGKAERKKQSKPSHKAPARKPAARSRRPAKPKTTPDNG
jgi:hypothetical protein